METTGLDRAKDQIIQFSAVLFTYAPATSRIYQVGLPVIHFENPVKPILAVGNSQAA